MKDVFFRYRLFFLALAATIVVAACNDSVTETSDSPNDQTVTGVLVDEQGFTVPEAVIEALNTSNVRIAIDTTDESGSFVLTSLPADAAKVQLRVNHADYKLYLNSLKNVTGAPQPGNPEGKKVILEHTDSACGKLSLHVYHNDNSSQASLHGVEVRLRRGDQLITLTTTDSTGSVNFQHLSAGNYNLRLSKAGYDVLENAFVITQCDTVVRNLGMQTHDAGDDSCCHGILKVIVRDSTNNSLLSGASVKLYKNGALLTTLTSNGDGVVIFTNLCPGTYNLDILKEQYHHVEFSVQKGCNDSSTVTKKMLAETSNGDSCCHGALRIVVRDSSNNSVIAGASVKLRKNGTLLTTLTSNGDGVVIFTGLCPGTYSLLIGKDGYTSSEFSVQKGCNDSSSMTRYIMHTSGNGDSCCHGALRIVVRDSSNNSVIAGASVKLRKNGTLLTTLTSNGDGVVIFTGLCPGTYSLLIGKDGYTSSEFSVQKGCNDSSSMTRYIMHTSGNGDSCCHGKLKVIVRDSTNNGVLSGASVKLYKNGALLTTLTSNGDGVVLFTGLCPGAYSLSINKEHYYGVEFSVQKGCNDSSTVTKKLLAETSNGDSCCHGKLKVIVRDSTTNALLADAFVQIWKNGTLLTTLTSNADGVVIFTGLCPGTYSVQINKYYYQGTEFSIQKGCNDSSAVTKKILPTPNNSDSCCHGKLKLIVRDSTTNAVLSGASVKLYKSGSLLTTLTTNGDGVVNFTNLCQGTYFLSIGKEHYQVIQVTVQKGCNDSSTVTAKLLAETAQNDSCCHGTLKVIVRDSITNAPIVGATVKIWLGNTLIATLTTNGDGVVNFTGLCAEGYSLLITRDGYTNVSFGVKKGCNEASTETKKMAPVQLNGDSCCHGSLKIVVRDSSDNHLIAGASVKLRKNGTLLSTLTSNSDGVVTFTNLCPGAYSLLIGKDGYTSLEFSVQKGCNDTSNTTRYIHTAPSKDSCCTAIFKVRVKDSTTNDWLSGVSVVIKRDGQTIFQGVTNAEGWFTKEAMCAPVTYTVVFTKQGFTTKTVTYTFGLPCATKQETVGLVP